MGKVTGFPGKKMENAPKKGVGRPRKINEELLRKLEEGFLMGLSDREACLFADVAYSTFNDYCKKHPKFSERKETLKKGVQMHAKINISNEIKKKKNIDLSLWYLSRKCSDEFSVKNEVEHSGGMELEVLFSDEVKAASGDEKKADPE